MLCLHGVGFPKVRGTILGVPIRMLIVFRGSLSGSISGSYHLDTKTVNCD